MKLHEFQAKQVLSRAGIAIPNGRIATTPTEAEAAATALGPPVVVKAQVHVGGRGKAGGVKLARNADEVEQIAKAMLGTTLHTHQTGPEGRVVRRLLIEQGMDLDGSREMYLAIVVDRATASPVFMASSQGGMDIEEVAAKTPERIHKVFIDPATGLTDAEAGDVARKIGIPEASVPQGVAMLNGLYRAFDATDASPRRQRIIRSSI